MVRSRQQSAAPGSEHRFRAWRATSGPLAYFIAACAILGGWQLAALALPDFLMPGIPVVLRRLGRDLQNGDFYARLGSSLFRLAVGYGAALALGAGLGLLASANDLARQSLKALVVTLQSIPSIAWVPLFLILMGFGNAPMMVVVAVAAFFPMALSALNATENIPGTYLSAARVMGASPAMRLRRVTLPAVTPDLVTGAQLAFGNAWRALISAEMLIGFGQGIGRALAYSGEVADMSGVLANILVIAVLAALIDQVGLGRLKRVLLRYRYTR